MPRIRTLKPEHKQHRKVGALPDREYRLWVGMITEADDEGRLVCDAGQLRALIWPYHVGLVTPDHVEECIQTLAKAGLIRLYTIRGVRYAAFPSWRDHQRPSHSTPSRLPPQPELKRRQRLRDAFRQRTPEDAGELRCIPGGSEGKGREQKDLDLPVTTPVVAPPGKSAATVERPGISVLNGSNGDGGVDARQFDLARRVYARLAGRGREKFLENLPAPIREKLSAAANAAPGGPP